MSDDDRIIVTGVARRLVDPDIAYLDAIAETRAATQRETFDQCLQQANAVLEALRAAAAASVRLSASGVSVYERWDPRGRKRDGYEARASVTARAPLADVPGLGTVALDAGAVRLEGPRFAIAEREAMLDEMLGEAVNAARARATRLAEAAGVELGRAVRIADRSSEAVAYGRPMFRMQAAEGSSEAGLPIAPGARGTHRPGRGGVRDSASLAV